MNDSFHLNTQIVGLLGHPIKHTFSPFIHNIAFEMNKLDYIYLPFDVVPANLKNAIKGIIALGVKGFNVTIPHKENMLDFMNNVSEDASIVGSINTVVNDMGKLNGYNTDVTGILETLNPYKKEISGETVSVVGSGGAARAVIYTLIRYFKPKKIFLINRTEQRAESLKSYFKAKMKFDSFSTKELFPPNLVKIFNDSKLIVNSTPVGMYPENDDSITTLEDSFTKGQLIFDLVYNPPKTKLMHIAESKGAITLDGVNMLVYQAAGAFKLWTGEDLPIEKLHKSLQLYINS
jgi:shikimate dehydrogenase